MKKGSNPLVRITGAYAFGIVLSQFTTTQLNIVLPAFLLVAATFIYLNRSRLVPLRAGLLGLLLLPAVAGLGALSVKVAQMRPGNAVEQLAGSVRELEMVALEDAKPCRSGRKVMVECRGEAAGRMMLYLPEGMETGNEEGIRAYDLLTATVKVRPLGNKYPRYAAYLRNQGVFATGNAMELKTREEGTHWMRPLADLRRELGSRILSLMPEQKTGGLAVAMLLGDRSGLDPELREDFSRAGLAHILAISGLHVGIVFIFLGRLLSFMAVSPAGARARTLLVIALLVVYMLLTGAGPAVCRAVMMLSMMELGKMIFRRHHSLNLLAASALVQLLVDPLLLFNIGFQLSYSAVAGILLLGPRIEGQVRKSFPGMGRKLAGSIAVCLAAQLCTAPLVAFHFQQFPTYFLLSNLALLPAVSVAVMLGFSGMLLVWVPGLAQVLFGMLDFVLAVIAWLSGRISALPGAVVENFSLSDPACLICLAMTGTILATLYRKELAGAMTRKRGLRFPSIHAVISGGEQWSRIAGYSAAGVLVMVTLLAG